MDKRNLDKKMIIILCLIVIMIIAISIVLIVRNYNANEEICTDESCEELVFCDDCVECSYCDGYGVFAGYVGECTACFGEDEDCLMCSGTGEVVYQGPFICTVCDGTGVICIE